MQKWPGVFVEGERIDRISSTVLAALMGHESSTITERRYVHLFDRQRTDEAVRQAMASGIQ